MKPSTIKKRLLACLVAAMTVALMVPAAAFAADVTKADIDNIIKQGITDSNTAMANNGDPYAQLSDLGSDGKVVVSMYDGDHKIKGNGQAGTGVYEDIIGVLVNALGAHKDEVATLEGVGESAKEAKIELKDWPTGTSEQQKKVVDFVTKLGLKGTGGSGSLNANGTISQLDGQSFQVKVTARDSAVNATYTVSFVLCLQLNDSQGTVDLDNVDKTVSGQALASGAAGAKASAVKGLFKSETSGKTVQIVTSDGKTKVDDNAAVGTGYKVQLVKDGNVVEEVTIIVAGDTSGDGKIDNIDAQRVLNHVVTGNVLTDVYEKAGHMTGQTAMSNVDAQKILNVAVVK